MRKRALARRYEPGWPLQGFCGAAPSVSVPRAELWAVQLLLYGSGHVAVAVWLWGPSEGEHTGTRRTYTR